MSVARMLHEGGCSPTKTSSIEPRYSFLRNKNPTFALQQKNIEFMGKSGETFGKKEKEKKRLKDRQEKQEKMEHRKANAKKGKSLDEMMAYMDENGNLSSTPPDP